jgi:hypothetical protein
MMDGWRKRMSEGDAVNLEDIKRGLGLGRDLGTNSNGRGLLSASVMAVVEDSLTELESSAVLDGISESEAEMDEDTEEEFDEMGANTGFGFTTTDYIKPQKPLAEVHGNAHKSPRRVTFQDAIEVDRPRGLDVDVENLQHHESPLKKAPSTSLASQHFQAQLTANNLALYESPSPVLFVDPNEERPVRSRNVRKRSSSPTPLEEERISRLTVQEKLNVAAAEAEAAMVAAGLNLEDLEELDGLKILRHGSQMSPHDLGGNKARLNQGSDSKRIDGGSSGQKKQQAESKAQTGAKIATTISSVGTVSNVKRTRITGRARRRKSTLTPQELEDLMLNC